MGGNFERAISPGTPPGLGDPERWGAHGDVDLVVPIAAGTVEAFGPQIVRAQVPDLLARGWLIAAAWSASGVVSGADPDQILFFLRVTAGVGQTSVTRILRLTEIARLNPFWVSTLAPSGQTIAGVSQLPQPLPATSIAICPGVSVTHVGAVTPTHTIRASFDVSISPVSLL